VAGSECLHLAALTQLDNSSDGGQRLVLVEEARVCCHVG